MHARNSALKLSGFVPVILVLSSLFTGFPVVEAQNYGTNIPPHPLACTRSPKLQKGNCTYYCNIFNLRFVVPHCEPDGITLLTCGDTGVCRRGLCRDTTCVRSDIESITGCLDSNVFSVCSTTIGETHTPRPTRKPFYPYSTTTTEETKYKEVKEPSSFSWKTLIIMIVLFVICALALIVLEKLSGFKFRDLLELRRSPRTISPRPHLTMVEPSAPDITPSPNTITAIQTTASRTEPGFLTPPPISVPEPFSLPPDLPPSYEAATAINDTCPSYLESKYKPGERRYT